MATNGIVLIKPSSVAKTGGSSTATINAGGSVTFSLCESLSLNGVFSSTYDNYIVDWRFTNSGGQINIGLRLRLSGTDASGSDYTQQFVSANNTTVSGARNSSQTSASLSNSYATQRAGSQLFVYGPNLAQPTAMRNVAATDLSSAFIVDNAATHSLSTAYDGFTWVSPSGTLSGLVKVYGLVK